MTINLSIPINSQELYCFEKLPNEELYIEASIDYDGQEIYLNMNKNIKLTNKLNVDLMPHIYRTDMDIIRMYINSYIDRHIGSLHDTFLEGSAVYHEDY